MNTVDSGLLHITKERKDSGYFQQKELVNLWGDRCINYYSLVIEYWNYQNAILYLVDLHKYLSFKKNSLFSEYSSIFVWIKIIGVQNFRLTN